jgi:LuxR family maltose regulon positive regulatory protein
VLEQVSGPLADVLRGRSGGERILQELEQAGAFVVSVDAHRSWFRYHQLFAELLRRELRCSAPGELPALHGAAARWYAEHGHVVEAVRHAQAAQDWGLAFRSLSNHMLDLVLEGQGATARGLLAAFPDAAKTADAELAALVACDEVTRGSLEAAERHLQRHARQRTAHAALIAEILDLLVPDWAPGGSGGAAPAQDQGGFGPSPSLVEPLTGSETRILRYLPTNLSAPEIAGQLSVSVNTVRTHMRHVYEKLGAHRRAGAVEQARALGLLAPSGRLA